MTKPTYEGPETKYAAPAEVRAQAIEEFADDCASRLNQNFSPFAASAYKTAEEIARMYVYRLRNGEG